MELEMGRANHYSPRPLPLRARRANRLASTVGRALRRAGEGLEAWAGPARADYSCPDAQHY